MKSKKKNGRGSAKGAPRSPARNTHKERGAIVTLDEIRAHRLPLHEKCRRGSGIVSYVVRDGKKLGVPCKCAHKRFMKAHPEVIIDKDGAAWWPAEES